MNAHSPSTFHEGLEIVLAHIIQYFMHFMKEMGLSTPQINVLMYIYHAGECQVSDISTLTDASPAAASQLVERLVQQGLVDRREDPVNRRTKILKLSGKGLRLIQRGVTSNHTLLEVMASLTNEQRETIQAAFNILAQATRQIQISDKQKDSKHA
jgi:DNA-binding MarR family transcriptional regulator